MNGPLQGPGPEEWRSEIVALYLVITAPLASNGLEHRTIVLMDEHTDFISFRLRTLEIYYERRQEQ